MTIDTKIIKKVPRITPIRCCKLFPKTKATCSSWYFDRLRQFYCVGLQKILHDIQITPNCDIIFHMKTNKLNIVKDSIFYNIINGHIPTVKHSVVRIRLLSVRNSHTNIMIINNHLRHIEWFDSCIMSNFRQYRRLYVLLRKYLHNYSLNIVNQNNKIQENGDRFCQSWIYYYVYQRLYKNKTPKDIINKIMNKNKYKRRNIILQFFHKISSFVHNDSKCAFALCAPAPSG